MCQQAVAGLFLIVSSITYLLSTSFLFDWIQNIRSTNKVRCIRGHIGISGSSVLFSVGRFISPLGWRLSDP